MSELNSLQQAQAARARNLAEWRASRLVPVEDMPSGMPGVVIRDLSMEDVFMLEGVDMPNVIVDMMLDNDKKQLGGEEDALTDGELILEMMKNKNDFNHMLDEIVRVVWVEPPLGESADDTHVTLAEIPFNDKMHVFNFLSREAQEIGKFPEQSQSGPPSSNGGSVSTETE